MNEILQDLKNTRDYYQHEVFKHVEQVLERPIDHMTEDYLDPQINENPLYNLWDDNNLTNHTHLQAKFWAIEEFIQRIENKSKKTTFYVRVYERESYTGIFKVTEVNDFSEARDKVDNYIQNDGFGYLAEKKDTYDGVDHEYEDAGNEFDDKYVWEVPNE